MEISWLGRNCFRLRGREGVVLTDPCPPESGYKLTKQAADVVTVSCRDEPGYSYVAGVEGTPRVLDAPGEYEIGGILITGVATRRADGSRNVVFVCELDGVRIGHLGLLTEAPSAALLDHLEDVNVLLLPVGGVNALGAAIAQDVMTRVDPAIAIPMNYRTDEERMELDPLDRFLRETGSRPEPEARLNVTRSSLPPTLTLHVLEPRS